MTIYCAVPGCASNSKTSDYTFHRFPRNVVSRARWVLALRRPVRSLGSCAQVCGRHFEGRMFSERGGPDSRGLVKNAVPTLFLPPKTNQQSTTPVVQEEDTGFKTAMSIGIKPKNHLQTKIPRVAKIRPNITKHSVEAGSSGPLAACRACLAADGQLLPLRGSGWEQSFLELTGVALSAEEGFPCHLCVFCLAKLSKCAAFRDSCQRSAALLRTLLERGPLTMNDIKAVDRHTHKLTSNLTQAKAYHFQTDPFLNMLLPQLKNESESQVSDYTEVEYLESDDGIENNDICLDADNSLEDNVKVEFDVENSDTHSETKIDTDGDATDTTEEKFVPIKTSKRKTVTIEKDTVKYPKKHKYIKARVDNYPSDIDTDTSEEIIEMRQLVQIRNLLKGNAAKVATEEFPRQESILAFEKEYDCKVKLLSKDEQKREVEDRKRRNRSEYCCDLCGKGYRNEATIMTHLTYHDPSLPHECAVCRLRFRSRHALAKHRHGHRALYSCNQCCYVSRYRTYAKDHYLMHKGNTYTCPYCHAVYNHQTSYYNHVRIQHPGQNEACDQCGETFAAGRGILMHKALRHRSNNKQKTDLTCTVCQATFLNAEALQRHSELSAGAAHAQWPCGACGDSCASDDARKAHAAEKHPPDQHYCQECDKWFASAASFALHVERKHRGRRAVFGAFRQRRGAGRSPRCICELCGKVLKNSTLLQYHLNGHLEVKPFQCEHCPKAFAHRGALNLHMRVHTGERPHQCEQCPLAFASQSNLNRHIKLIHLQQRTRVTCDTCGKTMAAASLAPHVRAVHQRRPYVRRKRHRTNEQPVANES